MGCLGSEGLGRVPWRRASSGIGRGSTNCGRVLTSSAGAMVATPWVWATACNSRLLPAASVVASKLDRCRNFRRVITTCLSDVKDTTRERQVSAGAPHLPCRYLHRDVWPDPFRSDDLRSEGFRSEHRREA